MRQLEAQRFAGLQQSIYALRVVAAGRRPVVQDKIGKRLRRARNRERDARAAGIDDEQILTGQEAGRRLAKLQTDLENARAECGDALDDGRYLTRHGGEARGLSGSSWT